VICFIRGLHPGRSSGALGRTLLIADHTFAHDPFARRREDNE